MCFGCQQKYDTRFETSTRMMSNCKGMQKWGWLKSQKTSQETAKTYQDDDDFSDIRCRALEGSETLAPWRHVEFPS